MIIEYFMGHISYIKILNRTLRIDVQTSFYIWFHLAFFVLKSLPGITRQSIFCPKSHRPMFDFWYIELGLLNVHQHSLLFRYCGPKITICASFLTSKTLEVGLKLIGFSDLMWILGRTLHQKVLKIIQWQLNAVLLIQLDDDSGKL